MSGLDGTPSSAVTAEGGVLVMMTLVELPTLGVSLPSKAMPDLV